MIMNKEDLLMGKLIHIDLSGPQGNAFALMGVASRLCRTLGLDFKVIDEELKTGDYDNLLETMERHFGDYILMYNR